MATHALAFVEWKGYRRSEDQHYNPPEFFYAHPKERLVKLVGGGGTLWVITSRRRKGKRRYSLAYKLVNCQPKRPDIKKKRLFGKHMVQSRDWRGCRYYSFDHDVTAELLKLSFMKPGDKPGKIGERIQVIKELTTGDIEHMETLEDRLLSSRMVFISYAHEDRLFAEKLEEELINRDIAIWRDVSGLRAGTDWETTIRRIASGTDCFLVLLSKNSDESEWVAREIEWATRAKEDTELVKEIMPIVLPNGDINRYESLKSYQAVIWPKRKADESGVFNRLASDIQSVATRKSGYEFRS
jgi:hypothetical protein